MPWEFLSALILNVDVVPPLTVTEFKLVNLFDPLYPNARTDESEPDFDTTLTRRLPELPPPAKMSFTSFWHENKPILSTIRIAVSEFFIWCSIYLQDIINHYNSSRVF